MKGADPGPVAAASVRVCGGRYLSCFLQPAAGGRSALLPHTQPPCPDRRAWQPVATAEDPWPSERRRHRKDPSESELNRFGSGFPDAAEPSLWTRSFRVEPGCGDATLPYRREASVSRGAKATAHL